GLMRGHVRRLRALITLLIVTALAGCMPQAPAPIQPAVPAVAPRPISRPTSRLSPAAWGQLPVYFVENRGQADPRVAYYASPRGATAYFTADGVTLSLRGKTAHSVLKIDFLGAASQATPSGLEQTDAVFSYFKGPPEAWKTDLPTYQGVVYRDLWPGI